MIILLMTLWDKNLNQLSTYDIRKKRKYHSIAAITENSMYSLSRYCISQWNTLDKNIRVIRTASLFKGCLNKIFEDKTKFRLWNT